MSDWCEQETCSGAIICVIAALPHIVDSGKKGREGYLETLTAAAKKLRRAPVRYDFISNARDLRIQLVAY